MELRITAFWLFKFLGILYYLSKYGCMYILYVHHNIIIDHAYNIIIFGLLMTYFQYAIINSDDYNLKPLHSLINIIYVFLGNVHESIFTTCTWSILYYSYFKILDNLPQIFVTYFRRSGDLVLKSCVVVIPNMT